MQSDLDNNTVNLRKAQKVVSISIVKKQIKENEKKHSCCDENFSLLIRQIELSKRKKLSTLTSAFNLQ